MLAYEETGKYVSERHAEAGAAGMLTAGEVAKLLNQQFKPFPKVTARELKPLADEWHHSGFYKSSQGSTMGRTYFFSPDINLAELYEQLCDARKEAEGPKRKAYIFATGWRKGYGRRKWFPLAKFAVIEVGENDMIADEISPEDYELLKGFEGEELEAYESFTDFKGRMLARQEVA